MRYRAMPVLRRPPHSMPRANPRAKPGAKRSMAGSGHPTLARLLLVLLAVVLGGWGAWRSFAPQPSNAREQLAAQTAQIANLQQQVANLARSDQSAGKPIPSCKALWLSAMKKWLACAPTWRFTSAWWAPPGSAAAWPHKS